MPHPLGRPTGIPEGNLLVEAPPLALRAGRLTLTAPRQESIRRGVD